MAQIKPLMGLRYNQEKVGNLATVVTPPYDIIDDMAQNAYYNANSFNIIRLELGKKYENDHESNNVYTRAAATFVKWYVDGALIKENKPALYLYQQEFQAFGETKIRTGFMCGLKAEDYSKGNVLPHEETLPKHKADRLELMKACEANFSPIFGLYSDPEKQIDKALINSIKGKKPDIEIANWFDEIHRLWVVTDENVVNEVVSHMANQKVFIADGHHRYETAVTYAQEMKKLGMRNCDHILITLVNLYDDGLVVLPTHRLVKNIKEFDFNQFLNKLKKDFEIIPFSTDNCKETAVDKLLQAMAQEGEHNHAFGLYGGDGNLYLLTLRNKDIIDQITDNTKSSAWRHLDVTILHTLILENILDIGAQERASEGFLSYTRDNLEPVKGVDSGDFQIALLMNPTKVEEVTAVAQAGEKMPQKSTFFYPKLITGLVINKLGQ
jgi:uncharacterized protein (DUF1015 family)